MPEARVSADEIIEVHTTVCRTGTRLKSACANRPSDGHRNRCEAVPVLTPKTSRWAHPRRQNGVAAAQPPPMSMPDIPDMSWSIPSMPVMSMFDMSCSMEAPAPLREVWQELFGSWMAVPPEMHGIIPA